MYSSINKDYNELKIYLFENYLMNVESIDFHISISKQFLRSYTFPFLEPQKGKTQRRLSRIIAMYSIGCPFLKINFTYEHWRKNDE